MTDPVTRLNAALEGRYRIERRLGEGGMATVYLADDLRHERKVALKVLKPELAAVVGADRFLAEIKTTANLQHPHILPLFDSGEADSFLFYVMPYVEGESLRERLDREHQLPVEEAVQIARNVAEALDYAHSRGVIHRDIKPANILLQAGKPVVSDFGIALAVSAGGAGRLTETGLSLGTPHYMSPEQATGDLSVGPAADVYALACVLYEMLVGSPPFVASTPQAVLGKIVTGDAPSAMAERKSVPPNVDAAIRRALEKVPADRFASAGRLADALADSGFRHADSAAGASARTEKRSASMRVAAGVALGLLVGIVGARLWPAANADTSSADILRFGIALPDSFPIDFAGNGHDLAISPDGRTLVYQSDSGGGLHLRLRRMDQLESSMLRGTEEAYGPVFSPDAAWVAFGISAGGAILRKVPLAGGVPQTLAELPSLIWGASWAEDDRIVVGTATDGLFAVPAAGGRPERLTTADEQAGEVGHIWPSVIPGRDAILFVRRGGGPGGPIRVSEIAALRPSTGEVTRLGVRGSSPRYLPTGHLAYVAEDGTVRAIGFNPASFEVSGSPIPLLEHVAVKLSGAAAFDVSTDGHMVYVAAEAGSGLSTFAREVLWVDRDGGQEFLPVPPRDYVYPRVSPDGGRVALDEQAEGVGGIWIWDFRAETLTRLVVGDSLVVYPTWTPDGSRIAYMSGGRDVWWKAANNTGDPELLVEAVVGPASAGAAPYFFAPDGSALVFGDRVNPETDDDLVMISLAPGSEGDVIWRLNEAYIERNAELSPDGRWMAYESNESGEFQIYVKPFPDVHLDQIQISSLPGRKPLWSRDGRELYYLQQQESGAPATLMSATLGADPATGRLLVSSREPIIEGVSLFSENAGRSYDVSLDGSRFLSLQVAAGRADPFVSSEITVVRNWLTEVRARVGER